MFATYGTVEAAGASNRLMDAVDPEGLMTDVGQGEADSIRAAAEAGTLTMDPTVARACAAHCDELIDTLRAQVRTAQQLAKQSGYGGFASSTELQTGFGNKGNEAASILRAYQEAAFKYKAAFLAAGQLFAEADAANADSLRLIAPGEQR